MKNEPFRFKGRFGVVPDPERCAASVSAGRATIVQCSKKRRPNSEWCATHEPEVVADDAPSIWAVESLFGSDPKLVSAKILKETTKQIKLEERTGDGFGYRTTLAKDPVTGKPEVGGRTPIEAVTRFLATRERNLRVAEENLRRARADVEQAKSLLFQTKILYGPKTEEAIEPGPDSAPEAETD